MKTIFVIGCLLAATTSFGRMGSVDTDNFTPPAFAHSNVSITYNFMAAGLTTTSDKRQKQDIAQLSNSLQKIMQLNGYSYRYKTNAAQPAREVGVLAQEVWNVLPEAVYRDAGGAYSVSYTSLVPLLINAMKEHHVQIEANKENTAFRKVNEDLKTHCYYQKSFEVKK